MKEGARVTEIHTALGFPQHFEGFITAYEPGFHWAMFTRPVTWGPASLPHSADYRFEYLPDAAGTRVSIACEYELKGLLRLPCAGWITAFLMRTTIRRLLHAIEKRAARLSLSH